MKVKGQPSQVFRHQVIVQKESGMCIIEVLPLDRRSRRKLRRRNGKRKKKLIPLPTIKEEEYEEMLEALKEYEEMLEALKSDDYDVFMETLNSEETNALEKVGHAQVDVPKCFDPTNAKGDMTNFELEASVGCGTDNIAKGELHEYMMTTKEGNAVGKLAEDAGEKDKEVITKKKRRNRKRHAKKTCRHSGGRAAQVTLLFKGVLVLIMGVIAMAVMAAGWKDAIN